jgi:ribosomal protein S3
MFGRRKEKEVVVETSENVIDNLAVEAYLKAFMAYQKIDEERVLIKNITSKHTEGKNFVVTIYCAFPGVLIGPKGLMVQKLCAGLRKHLDKQIKVEIKK